MIFIYEVVGSARSRKGQRNRPKRRANQGKGFCLAGNLDMKLS